MASTGTIRAGAEEHVEASLERIRQHPFVLDANADRLSLEQTHRWVMCAGRESRAFPPILESMLHHVTNARIRRVLAANLDDEHGSGDPQQAHFRHYLQLL